MGRTSPLRRLVGPRHAQRAHVIGRTALIELLSRDPALVTVYSEFEETVTRLALDLGALGNEIAHRAGLPDRAAVARAPLATVPPAYLTLKARFVRAAADAEPVLEQHLRALVFDTWKLEWPWLVFELGQHYWRVLNSLITGDGWTGTFSVPLPTPFPWESPAAFQRRAAARGAERNGVRVNEARIARDVRVFYRLRLKQPPDSIRSVTSDEGFSSPSNTKKAVDRAIDVLTTAVPPQIQTSSQ